MELTLEKSRTDPGALSKEHCIPLADLAISEYFQMGPSTCGDSRYLGATEHLLGCRANPPSPYGPSGPSTAPSREPRREGLGYSVRLEGTYNRPPVQELSRVGSRDRRTPCLLVPVRQGTWIHSDSALQVTTMERPVGSAHCICRAFLV